MDFINKGLSSILNVLFYGAIFFLVIYLLFSIVPIILVALAVIWAIIKIVKKITSWGSKSGSSKEEDNIEIIKNVSSEGLSNREVIDVDYREVR